MPDQEEEPRPGEFVDPEVVAINLAAMRRKRGAALSKVTKASNKLDSTLSKKPVDSVLTQVLMEDLEAKFKDFSILNDDYVNHIAECEQDNNTKKLIKEADQYMEIHESGYLDLITRVRKLLADKQTSLSETLTYMDQAIKMPDVHCHKFDGTRSNWPDWRDQFEATIGSQCQDDRKKIIYLRSLMVEGSIAEQSLMGYSRAGSSYAGAMAMLEENFGNKRLIAEELCMDLVSYKPNANMFEWAVLIKSKIDQLISVGYSEEELGILYPILKSKLHSEDASAFERHLQSLQLDKNPKVGISILQKWVHNRALVTYNSKKKVTQQTNFRGLVANEQPKNKSKNKKEESLAPSSKKCQFCSAEHKTKECDKVTSLFPDPKKRVEAIKDCKNCLNLGHKTAACRSKHSCSKCDKKHHTLLHFD